MTEQASTPLQEVGKRLKEARVKKGWSMENIVQRTRITHRHIVAIEAGDMTAMPAPVYARGFVKSYAKAVEIDEGPLMRLLDEAGILSATESGGARPADPPRAGLGPAARIWIAAAGVVLGGAIIGLGIRGIFKLVNASGQQEIPPSPFSFSKQAAKGAGAKGPEARRVKILEKTAKPGREALRAIKVSVTAMEECWVQVQSDDSYPQDLTLAAGESRFWGAESRLRLLVGNSGGIRAHSSWGPVKLPAKKGRVVHLLFTRKGEERLEVPVMLSATPAESATPAVSAAAPAGFITPVARPAATKAEESVAPSPPVSGTLPSVSSPTSTTL